MYLNTTVYTTTVGEDVNTTTAPEEKATLLTWDDATWILTSSFIIFTMQSGFGLLESGCVSGKNEVNIMVKNVVDVVFGGITYWVYGYGLSFGMDEGTNPFVGIGYFFMDASSDGNMGESYATFIFQLSFATTATTIVSGAMAERTKLTTYIIFSFMNTIIYCVPAHWLWGPNGFLNHMGVIDIAGSGGVHLLGAVSAFIAAWMLKPRMGRYDKGSAALPMGNATNALVGMFMLWWGWLGFNCGSTFGISGSKWKLAAKSAVTTICASMGGGLSGITYSYVFRKRKFEIGDIVNSILGSLVAITASCALVRPWHSIVIGAIGGLLSILWVPVMDWMRIDDPVGAVAVHGISGIWGMLAVGLFVEEDSAEGFNKGMVGLFYGGGFRLLGVQLIGVVCIIAWSALMTFLILLFLDQTMGMRMSEEEERLGSDFVEHGIGDPPEVEIILRDENLRHDSKYNTEVSYSIRTNSLHKAPSRAFPSGKYRRRPSISTKVTELRPTGNEDKPEVGTERVDVKSRADEVAEAIGQLKALKGSGSYHSESIMGATIDSVINALESLEDTDDSRKDSLDSVSLKSIIDKLESLEDRHASQEDHEGSNPNMPMTVSQTHKGENLMTNGHTKPEPYYVNMAFEDNAHDVMDHDVTKPKSPLLVDEHGARFRYPSMAKDSTYDVS